MVPGVPIGAQYNGLAEIFAATAVPAPQSLALLGLALALMVLPGLRRRA